MLSCQIQSSSSLLNSNVMLGAGELLQVSMASNVVEELSLLSLLDIGHLENDMSVSSVLPTEIARVPFIKQHVSTVGFLETEIHKFVRDAVVRFAGHFATETLGSYLIGIERFYLGIVK